MSDEISWKEVAGWIAFFAVVAFGLVKGCEARSARSWAAYDAACAQHPERFAGQRCALAALGGENQ